MFDQSSALYVQSAIHIKSTMASLTGKSRRFFVFSLFLGVLATTLYEAESVNHANALFPKFSIAGGAEGTPREPGPPTRIFVQKPWHRMAERPPSAAFGGRPSASLRTGFGGRHFFSSVSTGAIFFFECFGGHHFFPTCSAPLINALCYGA